MAKKKPAKLKLFDKIILALNILAAVLLLLSYFAPVSAPAQYWFITFLGLIYPALVLLNLPFIIYWFFRKTRFAFISIVTIILGVNIILVSFGFHSGNLNPRRDTANSLRVMIYNVHSFFDLNLAKDKALQTAMINLMAQQQPDVMTMEEFYVDVNTRQDVMSSLHKGLKAPYFFTKFYDYTRWDSAGVAIFSRFPIIAHGVVSPVNDYSPQAIYVDVKKGNKIFRVYCVHLRSTTITGPEHMYLSRMAHKGEISSYYISDIFEKLKLAYIIRAQQAEQIKRNADSCRYPYVIGGDFNDTPNSYAVNVIDDGLKNAFIEKGAGAGITYYGDFPHFQIDYILASPQFNVEDYTILKQKLSDHYPVVSDLSYK